MRAVNSKPTAFGTYTGQYSISLRFYNFFLKKPVKLFFTFSYFFSKGVSSYKQTTIHITHNHEEAFVLADRIGIMDNGKIIMVGTPNEVFQKPNSIFVANFLCAENIYDNASIMSEENHSLISYKEKKFYCKKNKMEKGKVAFCIRPGNILLTPSHPENGHKNVFKGTLEKIYDKGSIVQCIVNVGFEIVVRMMRTKFMGMGISQGCPIYVILPEDKIHITGNEMKENKN